MVDLHSNLPVVVVSGCIRLGKDPRHCHPGTADLFVCAMFNDANHVYLYPCFSSVFSTRTMLDHFVRSDIAPLQVLEDVQKPCNRSHSVTARHDTPSKLLHMVSTSNIKNSNSESSSVFADQITVKPFPATSGSSSSYF